MAKGKKTGAGDNAGAAQTGRFSDFSLDEARDVAQRNDPGPDVPSVSRVLLAEIARLEAELAQARAGNEQDPDAFTRNDHGAAALAWMRGTAVALGVGRADEGPLLLARALTHWIDLQRQGAQAQVQTEGGASDGPSAAMRMAGGRPMGPAARAQIPGHDAAWELTWYLGAQMRLAAAHWRNDEAGQETWLDLADYYERLDGPTREDSAAGARWLAHCVALWPKDDNGGRTGPAPGR